MVGRRRKSPRKLAASHQRSWLWGRHAVMEALTAARWLPKEVRLSEDLEPEARSTVEGLCRSHGIAVEFHPHEQLTRWCGTAEHQGLLALMPPYPYADIDGILTALPAAPLLLILDRIQDPHNFGAILRSADVFGVDAVFVGDRAQCEVTPHVARSSSGAVNHVPICRVEPLAQLLQRLCEKGGVRTLAATGESEASLTESDLTGPVALVIGNEGNGVDAGLLDACDGSLHIPQHGQVDSLNAAVAAGVLLYEARRQRDAS